MRRACLALRRSNLGQISCISTSEIRRLQCATPAANNAQNCKKDAQQPSVAPDGAMHWLDRRFPGVREWLEAKNRKWWLKGLQAWCRKYPALEGQQSQLEDLIQTSYTRFYTKHKHRIVDERCQTHLQVACLVMATYKTLLPWVRNQEEVLEILIAHMGGQTSPMLRFLVQSTIYLSPNPYKTLSNRLRGLQLDYGQGFNTSFTSDDRQSELRVHACFYHEIFSAEELPQLTSCCCCSQDVTWFHQAQSRNIDFQRSSCISDGDQACCLTVESQ